MTCACSVSHDNRFNARSMAAGGSAPPMADRAEEPDQLA